MKSRPIFEQLRQAGVLDVVNPATRVRFTISLRGWQNVLWAVRVIPDPSERVFGNPFTTKHRLMPRSTIEEWLSRLKLARRKRE